MDLWESTDSRAPSRPIQRVAGGGRRCPGSSTLRLRAFSVPGLLARHAGALTSPFRDAGAVDNGWDHRGLRAATPDRTRAGGRSNQNLVSNAPHAGARCKWRGACGGARHRRGRWTAESNLGRHHRGPSDLAPRQRAGFARHSRRDDRCDSERTICEDRNRDFKAGHGGRGVRTPGASRAPRRACWCFHAWR